MRSVAIECVLLLYRELAYAYGHDVRTNQDTHKDTYKDTYESTEDYAGYDGNTNGFDLL